MLPPTGIDSLVESYLGSPAEMREATRPMPLEAGPAVGEEEEKEREEMPIRMQRRPQMQEQRRSQVRPSTSMAEQRAAMSDWEEIQRSERGYARQRAWDRAAAQHPKARR